MSLVRLSRSALPAVTVCLLTAALLAPFPSAARPAPAPGTAGPSARTPSPPPASTPSPSPGAEAAPARTVSGWLPYWDQENAYQDALRHADQLHTVSPFWYQATSATAVDGHPGAGDRRIIDGLHKAGARVVPTVMETMRPGALAAILTDPARRARHVDALMSVADSRSYDGLDIDYESIATTGDSAYRQVRDGFAAFATDLCRRLRERHRLCVITVLPRTATTGRVWDYEAIGRAADRVRVMAYNLHSANGAPGPLADPKWYDDILTRATAAVPRTKLEMGLPAYGWDWPADGKGVTRHVTWKEADALRRAKGAPYRLDPASGTPHFGYLDGDERREVWYQDARGVAAHLPVLRRHGVRGTALWALGFEDSQVWPVLARG
ncbi:glycosyl hydrolase family 18 protein [Streptomyces sp. DT24]|uniref:glycosyl hydrolase family 18 protein n=1 Tax=Streptomyces sp. DT24 TaxID=3416520 RepID=UPI003CF642C7